MRRQTGAGAIASLILTCVFGATLLLSLAAGAGVYRRVQERTERGAAARVGLTYLAAKLRGADAKDTVYAGTFGGGDALYLLEDLGGLTYETILYVYDGQLRELLCEQGWEAEPQDGEPVAAARALTVKEPEPGLLRLEYTDGSGQTEAADIYLRSH